MLVLGSQSILGSFDEDELPPEATASMEADIAFLDDPDRSKADLVEAAIGEMSTFHRMNGVYAEGISTETAVLPRGWRDRLHTWGLVSSEPARPLFLEPHDLAIAKLARLAPKDRDFVDALVRAGMLDVVTLRERAEEIAEDQKPVRLGRIHSYLDAFTGGD
ncbi:DUF6036 family nucleotidyltransferase [Nocardioides sp. AE5]|uniref:DUF6036 family nucleotidyltransferase n=1 Tax=Nocardioides sp. AE5 TaxID=2962573 RepID=UPI002881FE9C|nr:DUF6036 family nucleotidyltransferase [Nocardioides sp. AE5]MDT0202505.1 hypothetical protein [Nocardioides sp. AE5]